MKFLILAIALAAQPSPQRAESRQCLQAVKGATLHALTQTDLQYEQPLGERPPAATAAIDLDCRVSIAGRLTRCHASRQDGGGAWAERVMPRYWAMSAAQAAGCHLPGWLRFTLRIGRFEDGAGLRLQFGPLQRERPRG